MHNMTELTESSDYWNPELLSQSLLGIWFAAAHQPWMNLHFIMIEICTRPQWQEALRQEIQQHSPLDYKTLEGLPLLDSFIKETVRLKPLDTRTSPPFSNILLPAVAGTKPLSQLRSVERHWDPTASPTALYPCHRAQQSAYRRMISCTTQRRMRSRTRSTLRDSCQKMAKVNANLQRCPKPSPFGAMGRWHALAVFMRRLR